MAGWGIPVCAFAPHLPDCWCVCTGYKTYFADYNYKAVYVYVFGSGYSRLVTPTVSSGSDC